MLYDVNAFNSIFQGRVNPADAGRAQALALKNERSELVAAVNQANESLARVATIGGKNIPMKVAKWMLEYDMPWEVFWCYEHAKWLTELDNLFPHSSECSRCNSCL